MSQETLEMFGARGCNLKPSEVVVFCTYATPRLSNNFQSICEGAYTSSPWLWMVYFDNLRRSMASSYNLVIPRASVWGIFNCSVHHCYWTALKTIAVLTLDPCSFLSKITIWTVTPRTLRKVPATITQWFSLGHRILRYSMSIPLYAHHCHLHRFPCMQNCFTTFDPNVTVWCSG